MSEKPFWEGKTCKEMAGLHVKATWKNGTIVTGVLDDTGDIDLGDNRSLYTSRGYDSSCDFEPIDNIQSIELLDDPEYERIDNIENVQVGDIACTTEGNHFRVIDLKPDPLGDMLLRIRISEIDGEYCIDSDDFAYALRRKPKLPDHDGLWWDKDNALWSVAISGLDNSKLVALLIGDPESPRHRVCLVGPQQQARDLSSSVPPGQGGGSMSIISSKAEHVYKGNTLMQEAYIAGASRQHTDEEIRAACLAIMPYVISQPSQQVFDFLTKATGAYPGQEIVRKVIEAMQRKATEE